MRQQENYNDLYAFLLVAEKKSFRHAAEKLGISSSALSKSIRLLEQRLGVQLFTRTTRTVALTRAGEQLFQTAKNSFSQLNNGLEMLADYRHTPSGLVRINAGLFVIDRILLPKLAHFKQQYPNVVLELTSENRFIDIVAEGFDAGIRLGDDVADGMIAVKISEPLKMSAVASPAYLEQHGIPKKVQDLSQHQCIGYRLSSGGYFQWTFDINGETVKITPHGQWVLNDDYTTKTAVKLGLGVGYLPDELILEELASGQLIRLFGEYVQSLPALYLYYPHRNVSPALCAVVNRLKI